MGLLNKMERRKRNVFRKRSGIASTIKTNMLPMILNFTGSIFTRDINREYKYGVST
jgi:hypothetical protein